MPVPLDQLGDDKARLRTLKEMLHRYSAPAAEPLIERRPDGAVQCFACGHRCVVKPGRDGVCRVRFNDAGTLFVPHGYVGALACDPIEKKPFFHVLPGSDALTFGMLGCDYHCGYCFTGDTTVLTDRGPRTLEEAFGLASRVVAMPDGDVGLVDDLHTVAGSGQWRRVRAVFRHRYDGPFVVVHPFYLPPLRCTPDHRVYATTDPEVPPRPLHARDLTAEHWLAIPRHVAAAPATRSGEAGWIDVPEVLRGHEVTHHIRRKLSAEDRERVVRMSAEGATSREIGRAIGKDASYVRHVRAKLARGAGDDRTGGAVVEAGAVRFAHERRPGLPARVELTTDFAALLGYYCAEGCVVRSKRRPNSFVLNFSFSHRERSHVERVCELLAGTLGVAPRTVERSTTSAVAVGKASAALLFKSLCGGRASEKRVPAPILTAPDPVTRAFLDAYVAGDGHRYANGKVSVTTVSRELAYGVALLALRLGHVPSVYDYEMPAEAKIQGRRVRRSARQFAVVWYEQPNDGTTGVERRVRETADYFLVPVRDVTRTEFHGDVFNMEVEEEHNYLANLLLVSNCQNWVTSQMLRDADAVAPPRVTTPGQLVELAVANGAPVVASSYNEPLITSEWAVDVFKEARAAGLRCAYISNGNATPQVLDFIRPYVGAYKVDLKTFNPRHYRQLGGVMENVTGTIRILKERGFWVEVVTLVVPGFSDDPDDLRRMADFLASVDPLMPWHVTAFHPDYKMTDGYRRTTADDLMRIVDYGTAAGLRYIYPGNLPGQVGEWENTRCHHCGGTVIRRHGFLVTENRVGAGGACPDCGKVLPGIWGKASGHGDGRVRPLRV